MYSLHLCFDYSKTKTNINKFRNFINLFLVIKPRFHMITFKWCGISEIFLGLRFFFKRAHNSILNHFISKKKYYFKIIFKYSDYNFIVKKNLWKSLSFIKINNQWKWDKRNWHTQKILQTKKILAFKLESSRYLP